MRAPRRWSRELEVKEIVLVTHSCFAHLLTGDVDERGEQIREPEKFTIGKSWTNVIRRSFNFQHEKDDDTGLVERRQ